MASVSELNETKRLIDPIHLFNTQGVNVLTAQFQNDRLDALEAENADLRAKIERLKARLRQRES